MRFFHVEVQIFRKTHRKYLAAFNGKYQVIHWKISKISRHSMENIKGFEWKVKISEGLPPLLYFESPLDSLYILHWMPWYFRYFPVNALIFSIECREIFSMCFPELFSKCFPDDLHFYIKNKRTFYQTCAFVYCTFLD